MTSVEIETKQVADIARRLGYRKKKVRVWPTQTVTLSGLNWSGGTKYEYHFMSLLDDKIGTAVLDKDAPWNNRYEGQKVELATNLIAIKTGIFCGKAATMYIYVHPDNMPRLING